MNPISQWCRETLKMPGVGIAIPAAIIAVAIAGVVFFYPFAPAAALFEIPREGEIAGETIIAPLTFNIDKSTQEMEQERRDAAVKVPLVLDFNVDSAAECRRSLRDLRIAIAFLNDPDASIKRKWKQTLLSNDGLSGPAVRTLERYPFLADEALAGALDSLDKGILSVSFVSGARNGLDSAGLGDSAGSPEIVYKNEYVALRRQNGESLRRCTDIPSKQVVLQGIIQSLGDATRTSDNVLSGIYEMLDECVRPNVFINREETARRMQKAQEEVLPTKGTVLKETEIVRTHQVVTADIVEKLQSLRKTLQAANGNGDKIRGLAQNAGKLLLIIALLALISIYIRVFHRSVFKENKNIMALGAIALVQMGVIRLGLLMDAKIFSGPDAASFVPEYIIPTSIASILTAIFFDARLSFVMSLFVSVFFGVAMGFNFPLFMISLMCGCVAGFTTRNIRYRIDFVKALPPIIAVYGALILIVEIMNNAFTLKGFVGNWGVAAVNCVGAIFLSLILTMVFENLFDIATNMSLIELSDMNHPILKRLSIEASGTYNHSVLVGNLAESAAERIGANSLLARVASYYHDIGKLNKAGYFIENMTIYEKSKHRKLSPNLSALLISSHVKEGTELARKYKLPKIIRDAIAQHHGTSIVSFFYEKAREQDPNSEVREEQFRYPGPLPQTRENAIIMLADSVEAASRSLAMSSPKLLRDLVKKVIRDKFSSAQLDQSNLTLRDLDEIVEGFMPVLQGIFHTRDFANKEGINGTRDDWNSHQHKPQSAYFSHAESSALLG